MNFNRLAVIATVAITVSLPSVATAQTADDNLTDSIAATTSSISNATQPDAVSIISLQTTDTTAIAMGTTKKKSSLYQSAYLGVPLIAAGLLVKGQDAHFRGLRHDYLPEYRNHVDDYTQFLPGLVMLGLKTAGVESRSSWSRMITSGAMSAAIMGAVVESVKLTSNVERPDGTDNHSFPSGHTATAFMTATMLSKEYGHISPWISIGSYSVATATGLMRVVNNKHWLSDVLTGAGVGIIATELGYWITDKLFKERGITRHEKVYKFDMMQRPSFLGIYVGMNIPLSEYDIDEEHEFSTSAGSTAGVEGAYFFNPYVGVGGRFTVTNTHIITDGTVAEDHTFDAVSAYAGAYFSLPLAPRWQIGSKALAGYVHYPRLRLKSMDVGTRDSATFGTGLSVTYRAAEHYNSRLFVDYNLLPSHSKGSREWMSTLAAGLSFAIAF